MSKAIHFFRPRQQDVRQGQLVVSLYDGALQYLQQVRNQMVAQKYANRGLLLDRVLEIIRELSKSLDVQSGGDLAVRLNNLYLLCSAHILRANQKMCIDDLDAVVMILSRLRSIYATFPGVVVKKKYAETPSVEKDVCF